MESQKKLAWGLIGTSNIASTRMIAYHAARVVEENVIIDFHY